MKKSVLIIPAKGISTRLPNKNILPVDGTPMVRLAVLKAQEVGDFDKIYVDTESEKVFSEVADLKCEWMKRPADLSDNFNKLMEWEIESHNLVEDYDLLFHLHCTAPFISVKTIRECKRILSCQEPQEADAIFTVFEEKRFDWTVEGGLAKPLYDTKYLPTSKELEPVYEETHGFYGLNLDTYYEHKTRYGFRPLMYMVPKIESYDIDTEEDYRIVQQLAEFVLRRTIRRDPARS